MSDPAQPTPDDQRPANAPAPAPVPAPVPGGAGDGTRAVHAGKPGADPWTPSLPGPVFAAHYHLPGEPTGPYTYGRMENPTWTLLEAAIAELEGGAHAVTFASGMGAVSAVLLGLVRSGQAVVLPSDCYQATRSLRARLESYGVTVRLAPTAGDAQARELDDDVALLWIETPSNPELDVCDIRRLADAAHRVGALVAVDNTLAGPLGQSPLALGADLVVASGTKSLAGHGDVLLGYVATDDAELAERVRLWRTTVGAIPGPMEAWLAHRSIATLQVRFDRQCASAQAIAERLRDDPRVLQVRYPGLPEDPAHRQAAAQMRRFGPVVSFTLADRETAERFLGALRIITEATSFGGVYSTAERRARWGGDAVPAGFVRLSVGIEDPADLLRDIEQALTAATAG
ncbi:cystathionine gamma-lyase [Allostreptomyces psammosilenae]|uniref:homocysteine desulfhydrase n=1 Tax=Allostreptomyces psammosilenae TaxID=1892865 RepID=A0A852ZSP1_9ACTN|nr:cystathionine gamma-lyase [Allostreptomyces psammosilenae]NYI05446.1 cystathionine gamma-lyase [Allostreptomyces psammosilenae]